MSRPRVILACAAGLLAAARAPLASAQGTGVRVGYNPSGVGNLIFFIAERQGYFRSEGLRVDLLPFSSSVNQVELIATNQIDVAGASPSADLYNEIARGNSLRIVADLGTDPPGYGYRQLLVRTDLIRSGRFKTLRDLKGMTIAVLDPGASTTASVIELLAQNGLRPSDVKLLFLAFPAHLGALRRHTVDATVTPEPGATQIVRSGVAVKIAGNDQFYPNQEAVSVIYSGEFIATRHDEGLRFMRSYIRAARFYNGALAGGKLAGPNADAVVRIITTSTSVTDPEIVRAMTPNGTDPNGRLNLASLRKDLALYKQLGLVHGRVEADMAVNLTFVNEALKTLGPYTR